MARVILRDVRLSFPDLFEAVQYQNQGPFQYRASFLFAPDSQAKKDLDAAIEQVAAEKWGAKAKAILAAAKAAANKYALVDGNTKAYNGYEGNWALTATRNIDAGAPVIVDRGKNRLTAADGKIYAGCYVNSTVEIWAQDNSFGKAIRATLVNVQFVKDGESFGGSAPATDDGLDDLGYDEDEELV